MPPVKSTPPKNIKKIRKKTSKYTQNAVDKALKDVRDKKMSIRAVCKMYDIPRSTLQDRLAGRTTDKIKKPGPDPILTLEVEEKIVEWLIDIAKCGFPIKKSELLDTVEKIIKDSGKQCSFKDDRPGRTWFSKFLKRHPEISQRSAEGINKARARVTEESIRLWFKDLEEYLIRTNNNDILNSPERIFNGDESGFALCPKTGKVLGPRGYRNLLQIQSGNEKENLTVLITFNANGQVCPPLIVFPYIRPPKNILDSLPPGWVLGKSESGWMKGDVFFEYITNDFIKWVDRNNIQKPVLLLVDGHRSHMSLELSGMCEQLGIILYALPPNTTHMLQPADVSVFGPLKSQWKHVVRTFLTKPDNINSSVTKGNFCSLFKHCLTNTNMSINIIHGFRKCGLYPFNPNAVDYTKCVQNTLERMHGKNSSSHNCISSKDITNADLVSTRKVLKHLKSTLAEKHIRVAVILREVKKLKKKPSEFENENENDVVYESEDQTNSTLDLSKSTRHEENNTASDLNVLDDNSTLHLSGSLLDIGSVVSLDDVLLIPTQINMPTTPPIPIGSSSLIITSPEIINDTPTTQISTATTPFIPVSSPSLITLENYTPRTQTSMPTTTSLSISSHMTITSPGPINAMVCSNSAHKDIEIDPLIERRVLAEMPTNPRTNLRTQTLQRFNISVVEKHLSLPGLTPKTQSTCRRTSQFSAISSEEWRQVLLDKQTAKMDKLELSRKRQEALKKKRMEKEKLKKMKTPRKRMKLKENNTQKINCAQCEDVLISDAEEDSEKNVGCDFCTKWYHLRCTDFIGLRYEEVENKPFKCNACILI